LVQVDLRVTEELAHSVVQVAHQSLQQSHLLAVVVAVEMRHYRVLLAVLVAVVVSQVAAQEQSQVVLEQLTKDLRVATVRDLPTVVVVVHLLLDKMPTNEELILVAMAAMEFRLL
jgi:hypothetical protein